MRYFLNVLFVLAVLPAVAKAATFAEYNSATGDIRIREVSEIGGAVIRSASGSLNPNVATALIETAPAGAGRPGMRLVGPTELTINTRGPFPFTSITIYGAFIPGTPISDVSYFDTYRVATMRQGAVVAVPEPPSVALGSLTLLSFSALRCRK